MTMMERMFDAKVSPFAQQVDRLLGEVEYMKAKQGDSDYEEEEEPEQGQNLAELATLVAGVEGTGQEGAPPRPVRSCRAKAGGRDAPYQKN